MRFLLALLLSLLPGVALAAPLSFTIGTSEPVVVDTTGGTPLIWLDFGGDEVRAATYRAGSGTAALEFAYDITAGDFAPSGIVAAGQIELAGGAIRDLAGNPLTLSFTPPDLSGVRVRTYRPVWTTDPITAANASAAAFEITKAPLGATFAWEITSDGGGSLSGSGTISAAPHPVTGLNLSALGDGTLTLSLTLTTAAGTSAPRTVTVGKFTGWSPADLGTAVALWLDADDAETITLSEGAVSEWRDKSGNGRHVAQADAARRPVPVGWGDGSREAIAFDGTDDFLQGVGSMTTGTYAGHFNVIWAASRVGNGGVILTERSSTLVGVSAWTAEGAYYVSSDGANVSSNHQISAGVFGALGAEGGVVSHLHFPGSRDVLYLNGAQQTVLTASASNITGGTSYFRIGRREPPHSYNWNGTILEIIVLLEFLGSDDRQRLEGYLAHKWGLAGSLPAGHPWKAGPP